MVIRKLDVVIAASAAVFCSAPAGAQSLDGAYRGMFVCEQMLGGLDVLHVPLDVVIRNGAVQSARPVFNWNGTRVLGSELASGTIDAEGKLQLMSNWYLRGVAYDGRYSGTLTSTGGTLSGTQSWRGGGNLGSRTCTAALVPAPKARHAGTQNAPGAPNKQD
jgi:hypothetical protein